MELAKAPDFVLGVVGSTGTGKSCLINALLGEAQLVPTNCVRACTAVITEISWNPSDNPEEKYIASVEFISPEEWHYELDKLFNDLTLPDGKFTEDANNHSADAEVALAKIQVVYPQITRQELAHTDIDSLANDPDITELLGATHSIRGSRADRFYKDIRVYIDSKEKLAITRDMVKKQPEESVSDLSKIQDNGENHGDDHEQEPEPATKERQMELWPLIKVVKIQTKADILSTGAIIVDLVSAQSFLPVKCGAYALST